MAVGTPFRLWSFKQVLFHKHLSTGAYKGKEDKKNCHFSLLGYKI